MEQATEMDQTAVVLLRNFADGVHSGYVGDVVLLSADLAALLVEAGAAVVFEEPAPEEPREPAKPAAKGKK